MNIIDAVYTDTLNIWAKNDFESEDYKCDCADKLHVWLHVLDPNNKTFSDYRHRKAKSAVPIIVKKSDESLECGHKWYSDNCKQYIREMEELLSKLKN